jgi:hypothetical protein
MFCRSFVTFLIFDVRVLAILMTSLGLKWIDNVNSWQCLGLVVFWSPHVADTSSSPVFSGVRVARYMVLCVCFVDRCLSFCPFSFDHCVVSPYSIYGFWLPLWYLHILLAVGSGMVRSSCSTSGTRRVSLVINPVISREWGKDRGVLTTSGTYPWSFVTYIFCNG